MKFWLYILIAVMFLAVSVQNFILAFTWIPLGTFHFVMGAVNLFFFGHRCWLIHRLATDPKEMKKLLKK